MHIIVFAREVLLQQRRGRNRSRFVLGAVYEAFGAYVINVLVNVCERHGMYSHVMRQLIQRSVRTEDG